MRNPTHISGQEVDLTKLTFSAKVAYLTILTGANGKLPLLSGEPKWPRQHHGQRLTIHNPSPLDLAALLDVVGFARLLEVEIAVDVKPKGVVPQEQREALLQSVVVGMFARGLEPSAGEALSNRFRSVYRRIGENSIVCPFNKSLPRATDQQMHGRRDDPAQVKAYLKRTENRIALPSAEHVARVEVRLGSVGLDSHGLEMLADLWAFQFRRRLMPYFTHVRGTRRPVSWKNCPPTAMRRLLAAKQEEFDQEYWDKDGVGVGAFLHGGERDRGTVRFVRNSPVNSRIGQALSRLEQQFLEVL